MDKVLKHLCFNVSDSDNKERLRICDNKSRGESEKGPSAFLLIYT